MFKCSESSFSKTSIPSLEGIMIKAEGNTVTLTGYDLEVGMITSADADVKENGSIILNAKILCDILRNLPEDRVSFEADERLSCKIKSGEAEFTLVGTSSAEYPELPSVNGGFPVVIDSEILKDMIRKQFLRQPKTTQNSTYGRQIRDKRKQYKTCCG